MENRPEAVTPSPRPPPARPYGHNFAEGFADAHRQKIFLWLSVAGTLLLGPFAVNNFIQDRIVLGIATSLVVGCLLVDAAGILRRRGPFVSASVLFAAVIIGLTSAMYNLGLIGILWVYPGILLFHFMLPRRRANVFNITMVLLAIVMAWIHLGPELTARVGVTLTLLVIFSNIFSYVADVQQRQEAEQRERLDGLVRQLEAQNTALREAFRLREEVERIARHDLKTPLASIASVPRLLREGRPLDAREHELVGMVERAALRVLSMVNLSLDLYRMEEGTYRLRAQAVDLAALARTVARELQAHAQSKNLRLALDLPTGPLYAQGEELLCYSVVANLLKNALEASPDGAEVQVRVRLASKGEAVVVAIHNRGEVPEAVRANFFSKYATHGKPGGTGLGAFSAHLMARVQQGDLHMESAGGGTTLTLRLPTWHTATPVQDGSGAFPAARLVDVARPLLALSVLLADDDEYNIILLKGLLPSPPLTVRTAVNGRAALECVREQRPDVIFLDVEMPVMGGIEAAEAIRALQHERGEVPSLIAAFSAYDDELTRRRCLEAGFDLYLAKPASREELLAVLRREDPAAVAQAAAGGETGLQVRPELMALLPEFLSSRRELAQQLATAAAEGARDMVRTTAHKLAGSLAVYGFTEASRASLAVENAAGTVELPELRRMCQALIEQLEQARPGPPVQG